MQCCGLSFPSCIASFCSGATEMNQEAPAHEPFLPAAALGDLGVRQLRRFRSSSSKRAPLGRGRRTCPGCHPSLLHIIPSCRTSLLSDVFQDLPVNPINQGLGGLAVGQRRPGPAPRLCLRLCHPSQGQSPPPDIRGSVPSGHPGLWKEVRGSHLPHAGCWWPGSSCSPQSPAATCPRSGWLPLRVGVLPTHLFGNPSSQWQGKPSNWSSHILLWNPHCSGKRKQENSFPGYFFHPVSLCPWSRGPSHTNAAQVSLQLRALNAC